MDSVLDVARTQSETAVLVDSVSQMAERYEMITKEQFKRNLERRKRKAAIKEWYELYTTQFIGSFRPNGLNEAAPSTEVLDKWKQQLQ